MPIQNVFLFHGKGGRPTGSVLQLEELLRPQVGSVEFSRPSLPHGDPNMQPEASLEQARKLAIPHGSAIVGVSLGGLVAAKLQELDRKDLHVICISSPTSAGDVVLSRRMDHRLALYSSLDDIIAGRTSQWPRLAHAFDLPWLTHDTDAHKHPLAEIIAAYLKGEDILRKIVEVQYLMRPNGRIS